MRSTIGIKRTAEMSEMCLRPGEGHAQIVAAAPELSVGTAPSVFADRR